MYMLKFVLLLAIAAVLSHVRGETETLEDGTDVAGPERRALFTKRNALVNAPIPEDENPFLESEDDEEYMDEPQEGDEEYMDEPQEGGEEYMDEPQEGGEEYTDEPQEGGEEYTDEPQEGGEEYTDEPQEGDEEYTEEPEEEVDGDWELSSFEHAGVKYLKDDENYLYDPETEEEVGFWNGSEVEEFEEEGEDIDEGDEEGNA